MALSPRYTAHVFLAFLLACAPTTTGEDSAIDEESPPGPVCPAEHPFSGSVTVSGPNAPASAARLLAGFDGITGSIFLDNWPEEDLSALRAIRCIDGRLDVHSSVDLRSLRGLDQLTRVTTIQLSNLPELTTLDGLGDVVEMEALLVYDYDGHSGLESFDGLDRLRKLQVLDVSGPRGLAQVDALFRITELTTLHLYDLPGLTDLSGLASLASVEDDVDVLRNDSLTTLSGLGALELVGDNVRVVDNPSLPQADAEAWAMAIDEVGGDVSVQGNGP